MFNLIETAFAASTTGAADGTSAGLLGGSPIIMIVAMAAGAPYHAALLAVEPDPRSTPLLRANLADYRQFYAEHT